jgi:hypothetical protein
MSDNISKRMLKHGQLSIARHCTQQFMSLYAQVAKRWDGMGLKLTKFHQLRHWYFYIAMYGVPLNFDSSFCESHHLHLTKKTGRRTQKHQDTLAFQTATRVYEKNLMDSICQYYYGDPFAKKKQNVRIGQHTFEDNDLLGNTNCAALRRGARFSITLDYRDCDNQLVANPPPNIFHVFDGKAGVTFRWRKKRDRKKRHIPHNVMHAIANKLSWFNNGRGMSRIMSVMGFTELRMTSEENDACRTIVRAHPDYRGEGQWTDWIDVCWELDTDHDEGEINVTTLPARVVLMLDFDTAEYAPIPDTILTLFPLSPFVLERRIHKRRDGVHVLVHSAAMPLHDGNEGDVEDETFPKVTYIYSMEPVYQFIKAENIKQLAFVAPDPPDGNNGVQRRRDNTAMIHPLVYQITKVSKPTSWSLTFEHNFSKDYSDPHPDDIHLDEFNETFNPWS